MLTERVVNHLIKSAKNWQIDVLLVKIQFPQTGEKRCAKKEQTMLRYCVTYWNSDKLKLNIGSVKKCPDNVKSKQEAKFAGT